MTRLGQLVLAGEVVDAEPIMPSTLRVMDAYVLSVLIDGEGNYRDADGRDERIGPGAHTIVPPGFPHTYGTDPGERWTEMFVVFTGPLFDALAERACWPAPARGTRCPAPSVEALRTVLRDAAGVAARRRAPAAGVGRLAARHRGPGDEQPAGPEPRRSPPPWTGSPTT